MHSKQVGMEWRSACPVSCAMDVLGDKWSLLIIRDLLMFDTRTYSNFRESSEHISTNILAERLKRLTAMGVIERINPEATARNNAFQLTESGQALRPVVESIYVWADSHLRDFNRDTAAAI